MKTLFHAGVCSLELTCVHGENHGKRERFSGRVGAVLVSCSSSSSWEVSFLTATSAFTSSFLQGRARYSTIRRISRKSWVHAPPLSWPGGAGHRPPRKTLSVMRKPLDEHFSVVKHCNVHLFQHTCEQPGATLCRPRFQPERSSILCTAKQNFNNPWAQAMRGCVSRASILGTPHNHESHGCSGIQGMRA